MCETLAWRLLATLETGSALLAASALLAYAAPRAARALRSRRAPRAPRNLPPARSVDTVLVTNVSSSLGSEIKRCLEMRGCRVQGAESGMGAVADNEKVDALVVVGARGEGGLDALADLVAEDTCDNLKLLERLRGRVREGGRVLWAEEACSGASSGAFSGARAAFQDVLKAALQHVAAQSQCSWAWVERGGGDVTAAARRVVTALLSPARPAHPAPPAHTSYLTDVTTQRTAPAHLFHDKPNTF